MAKRIRRLKWRSKIKRFKALDRLCQEITMGDPTTVVAFGSASFRCHAPVKAMRKRLQLHSQHVVPVHEYNTSKVCPRCKEPTLVGVRVPNKSKPLWGVRVCQNSSSQRDCRTICNRDLNAARNIRDVFLHMNANHGQRPPTLDHVSKKVRQEQQLQRQQMTTKGREEEKKEDGVVMRDS